MEKNKRKLSKIIINRSLLSLIASVSSIEEPLFGHEMLRKKIVLAKRQTTLFALSNTEMFEY